MRSTVAGRDNSSTVTVAAGADESQKGKTGLLLGLRSVTGRLLSVAWGVWYGSPVRARAMVLATLMLVGVLLELGPRSDTRPPAVPPVVRGVPTNGPVFSSPTRLNMRRPVQTFAPDPPIPTRGAAKFKDRSAEFDDVKGKRAYRRSVIVDDIDFSFSGYRKCAWGHDEARPISCTPKDWAYEGQRSATGLALTMIDSLSTLVLANLTDHTDEVLRYLEAHPRLFDQALSVSQFESTIRFVGGLLSAYELLGQKHAFLLNLARDIGERVLGAFKTPTKLPDTFVDLRLGNHSNPSWHLTSIFLSEIGTNALEFRTLTYHTGDKRFAEVVARANEAMMEKCPPSQLCPTHYDQQKDEFANEDVSLGGLADSYFEYLLKMYVHAGFTDLPALSRFLRFFESARAKNLVKHGYPDELPRSVPAVVHKGRKLPRAFVNFLAGGTQIPKMDHLSCFAGGMFILAAETVDFSPHIYDSIRTQQELSLSGSEMRSKLRESAVGVTETCVDLYAATATGIGPEIASLANPDRLQSARPLLGVQPYVLRPEALESLFYLHYFEGSTSAELSVYEEQAWAMYLAIREACRVEHGYSGILDVSNSKSDRDDVMQSFWIAETLKYLLLLFTERELVLDVRRGWVFNTEAHPLRIREDLMDKVMVL